MILVEPRARTNEIVYSFRLSPESTEMLFAPMPVTADRASEKQTALEPIGMAVVEFVP